MKFTFNKNKFLAIVMFVLQILTQSADELTKDQKTTATLGNAAVVAALQLLAHKRNPDGSKADGNQ